MIYTRALYTLTLHPPFDSAEQLGLSLFKLKLLPLSWKTAWRNHRPSTAQLSISLYRQRWWRIHCGCIDVVHFDLRLKHRRRGIIEQIARGLRAFHRQEMLHQDIRANNIMIDQSATVKIIDLGSTFITGKEGIQTSPDYFVVLTFFSTNLRLVSAL